MRVIAGNGSIGPELMRAALALVSPPSAPESTAP
jgi:hypothetical protein